jgi:predicted short-subunit dehydrogenase-like oxidoreductase (DUF2520 family)
MRELERDRSRRNGQRPARDPFPRLAVIGPGRAGGSIARAAREAGLEVEAAGRDGALDACRRGEAALLCVPDAAIAAVAASIVPAIPPLRLVGHVSGAHGLEALEAARVAGAEAFALHPLQTLPDGESALDGAACAVGGSTAQALAFAEALATALGMRPFVVADEDRVAYHAAASMASNFLVALEESASELLGRIAPEDARELLAPLVLRAAANWAARGGDALTGPIARGDEDTVERHRAAIGELAPELLDAYDALAERSRAIAGARPAAGAATG